jgi:hypothetical protein
MKKKTITITKTITEELDPCQAPDGCPELEPWMAYLGIGPFEYFGYPRNEILPYLIHLDGSWTRNDGTAGFRTAVDVRTAWAQEHFPEHCEIRNYQEPDAFEEYWSEQTFWAISFTKEMMKLNCKEAYELGQANPKL